MGASSFSSIQDQNQKLAPMGRSYGGFCNAMSGLGG